MAIMKMPFGKYSGQDLDQIPESYLCWVLDNCKSIAPSLRQAIEVRLGINRQEPSPPATGGAVDIASVIRAWHRRMTMKYHPDRDGSTAIMQVINESAEVLREIAGLK